MTAGELLADLRTRGFEVTTAESRLRVSPASRLTPADRDAIRAHLAALVVLAGGTPECPQCRGAVDDRRRCWRCFDRVCEVCGRPTGTAFISTCLACDFGEAAGRAGQRGGL